MTKQFDSIGDLLESKRSKFKDILVGEASFASGMSFRIYQIKPTRKDGTYACRVFNVKTGKNTNFTHSIDAAWRSVKFMAKLHPITNRTPEGLVA